MNKSSMKTVAGTASNSVRSKWTPTLAAGAGRSIVCTVADVASAIASRNRIDEHALRRRMHAHLIA